MSESDSTAAERFARVEGLLKEVENSGDEKTRAQVREIVQCLMDLHAAGIERILKTVADSSPGMIDVLAGDELVASLMLLYGLHPQSLAARVNQALEKVRGGHPGKRLELLEVNAGNVRVAADEAIRDAVIKAITEGAPDVESLRIDTDSAPAGEIGERRMGLRVLGG